MASKKILLGMLVMILAFGMTVIGCDDDSDDSKTTPSVPTGLAGIASSNSVQLNWNAVSNADEYWIQYKNTSTGITEKITSGIKTNSYNVTGLSGATTYEFQVAAHNGYTSAYSSAISVTTDDPETASVSVSIYTSSYGTTSNQILVSLKLSDGAYWKVTSLSNDTAKSWVTMSGTPDVSSWTFSFSISSQPDTLSLFYNLSSASAAPSGLTATLNSSKLSEMKGYTNVVTTLSAGTPSSASSSGWNYQL